MYLRLWISIRIEFVRRWTSRSSYVANYNKKLSLKKILFHLFSRANDDQFLSSSWCTLSGIKHNESPTFVIRYRARSKRRLFEIASFLPVVSLLSLGNSSSTVIEFPSFVAGSVRNGGNVYERWKKWKTDYEKSSTYVRNRNAVADTTENQVRAKRQFCDFRETVRNWWSVVVGKKDWHYRAISARC